MPSREQWAESFNRAEQRLREIHANLHLHPDTFYLFHSLVLGICQRSNYHRLGLINDTQCYVVSSNLMRAVGLMLWPADPDQRGHLTITSPYFDAGKWPPHPTQPTLIGPEARFHGNLADSEAILTEEQTCTMYIESSIFSMLGWLIMRYVSWTRYSRISARPKGTPEELAIQITRIHTQHQPQLVPQLPPLWPEWQSQEDLQPLQVGQNHGPLGMACRRFPLIPPTYNSVSMAGFHGSAHGMLPLRPLSAMETDHGGGWEEG